MAINNHTTASSSPLARTDTPQPATPVKPTTLLDAAKANDAQAVTRLLVELEQAGKDVVAEVNRVGEMVLPILGKSHTATMTFASKSP